MLFDSMCVFIMLILMMPIKYYKVKLHTQVTCIYSVSAQYVLD